MPKTSWQPLADKETLQKRAQLLQQLRSFFMQRDLLEVDVPLLTAATVSDVYLEPVTAVVHKQGEEHEYYLNTSPEFYMKRLLAAGHDSIFYLGKAFRQEEIGRRHHYEFTLLEWYRVAWDETQLIQEVLALLQLILPNKKTLSVTYAELFQRYLAVNIFIVSDSDLLSLCQNKTNIHSDGLTRNDCLDVLFSLCIEPHLDGITVVKDYPASMAALAKVGINNDGNSIAHRFEVFVDGLELANGYWELQDASEQQQRFERDQLMRQQLGKAVRPLDDHFLRAMQSGLPACAGVALGVDRLLMVLLGKESIQSVLPFAD